MRPSSPRTRASVGASALCLLAAACVLLSCGPFEYTPYATGPGAAAYRNDGPASTAHHLARLAEADTAAAGGFSLALLADSHSAYDALEDAVASVNGDSSIRFTILAGDFTQYGLLREYEWFRDLVADLRRPWITVIGNHDARANGAAIYRGMFGPLDYAFTYGGVRFVCANTNAWDFSAGVPDWSWLEAEVAAAPDSLRVVTVSHIPPFGDQFDSASTSKWRALLARRGVELSLHGHQHNHRDEQTYGDGVRYVVADDVGDRNWVKVTITPAGVTAERVWF